jgi:DNA-binding XRE family transcriptional regulator
MEREEFIVKCNEKLKLIRTEYNFSQEKTAQILGFSKKTVVEIEKGRSSLGWTGAVALCAIFGSSEILSATFGGKPTDVIMALAFEGNEPSYPKTMGGKVWWKPVEERNGFKVQQNIISQHYRILDGKDRRICSSFEWKSIQERFLEALENGR